ncbi:uncharacterized protein LOC114256312 [Camellia sinensis]|uniref:uncharacterized protein LOC114256312 n=1 Tax=Camellia sinensis TaxID=4442 RepID=UPI001036A217|nr:uncharacterized protein LOC114256312 [Camellia sinensis]
MWGGEEEIDALQRFCHHKETMLLSASWENDVRTSKNLRVSSDLVSSTIFEIMRDKPLTRPCEVVTILKMDYGLDLRWYSDAVMRYNPGSYVNIDYDVSTLQFCRFFVSFDACLFPVAFVIVDSETTANWLWFLHELRKAHHGYCLKHLKNNLRDWMKGIDNGFRDHLVSSLGDCAYKPTVVGGMHYGEITFNAAESFNNWIKEVSKANEDTFEVNSIPSAIVDIARHTCSCFKWKINGFPCDHAVITIQKSHYNLNNCVEHYFHMETYRAAYLGAIFPILSVKKPSFDPTDFIIYPPTVNRPPIRSKKNRILSME